MIPLLPQMSIEFTADQLARLLFKSHHEPRRNLKQFIRDLGGLGTAEELNEVLAAAKANEVVKRIAERMEIERDGTIGSVELKSDTQLFQLLDSIKKHMDVMDLTQSDVATMCGWSQELLSEYLSGKVEPGVKNLAKLAASVGLSLDLSDDGH